MCFIAKPSVFQTKNFLQLPTEQIERSKVNYLVYRQQIVSNTKILVVGKTRDGQVLATHP